MLVDQKHGDAVWVSEPWGDRMTKLDPKTGAMKQFPYPAAFHNNFAIDPNGFLYGVGGEGGVSKMSKMDPNTGETVATYTVRGSYDSAVSRDGKYWAGGGPSTGGNYGQLVDLATGKHILLTTGLRMASPSRGGWDASGNAWFGGKNGSLVRYDTKTMRMKEFFPPLPVLGLLRGAGGQERRSVGRSPPRARLHPLQPEDGPVDRVCPAGTIRAQPARVDR